MSDKITKRRAIAIFDALVKSPEGLDIYQIGDLLGLTVIDPQGSGRQAAFAAIRQLRLQLGALNSEDDERIRGYSVPIRRDGTRQFYVLAANIEAGTQWQEVRADTLLSRLEVDLAHWQSMMANTDGRTVDGRVARAFVKHYSRLLEDVRGIREELPHDGRVPR